MVIMALKANILTKINDDYFNKYDVACLIDCEIEIKVKYG